MKKILSLFSLFFFSLVTIAQEVEEYEPVSRKGWSDDTKIVLMIVFAVLCVILAIRTFRNKPEA